MQMRYDPKADAAYMDLSKKKVEESEEVLPGVILDFDKEGRIVGIEVLDASRQLPEELIAEMPRTKKTEAVP
jgi:uncharacterized protein YuzE